MLCPHKLPKNSLLASLHAQHLQLGPFPMAFARGLYPPLPIGSPPCQLLDNVTLHLLLIIRPTALVCAAFLLQRGELSCQMLIASFSPRRFVSLGPDSRALILRVYPLSEIDLGLGS